MKNEKQEILYRITFVVSILVLTFFFTFDANAWHKTWLDLFDWGWFDGKTYVNNSPGYLGKRYLQQGNYKEAILCYSKAIELNKTDVSAYIELAWLLSTCVDDKYRDGLRAIDLTEKAITFLECRNIISPNALVLSCGELFGVQAAAYAEVGKYEEAIKLQEKALIMLKNEGYEALSKEHEKYLKSFIEHKPWRHKYNGTLYHF
ncbi:MAG: tetratricopeptide repeat protein [Smithella sp.]